MLTRIDATLSDQLARVLRPPAVVVGAGLGGLAAAMRLGAKGYRVTVLDRLDMPGGRASAITVNGHRFDLGPTIVTVPQMFRELWADCGRDFDADVDLRPLDPFYEIRFPDGATFSARQDASAMRAEVERLSPSDLAGYDRFLLDSERRYHVGYEDLGRRSMDSLKDLIAVLPAFARLRADRSVHSHAALRVKDERLRMALSFHPLFIGGDPFHVTSIYILVSHLERRFGVHYAMGGTGAIAAAMACVIEDQGGEVRLGTEIDEIVTEAGRVTGVRTTDGETFPAAVAVSNADPGQTYGRLLGGRRKRWTRARLERQRWSMGLFVWYFGTKGTRKMWSDVGHHTILNGPRYRDLLRDIFLHGKLAEDFSLYLHRPTVTDPSAAPPGDDTFYALSPVPHLGFANAVNWTEAAEPYRERVAAALETMMPGLRERVSASLTFTPDDFRDRYLSPHGCGFSIEPRILQSAWFRPHNRSEEVAGLYLVGAGTHPGAGLPGVIASAEVVGKLVPDAAPVGAPGRRA
jgi:phytoene desaturase